jgi:DNA-binding XRE family transcriptional regulator
MLHGKNAKYYRQMVSGVSVEDLSKYVSKETIEDIENEYCKSSIDTILQYYKYINDIKKYKGGAVEVKAPAIVKETPPAKLKRTRKKATE